MVMVAPAVPAALVLFAVPGPDVRAARAAVAPVAIRAGGQLHGMAIVARRRNAPLVEQGALHLAHFEAGLRAGGVRQRQGRRQQRETKNAAPHARSPSINGWMFNRGSPRCSGRAAPQALQAVGSLS